MSMPSAKLVTSVRKMSPTEKFPDRSWKSKIPSSAASRVFMQRLLSRWRARSTDHEDRADPLIVKPVARGIETEAVLADSGEMQVVARHEMRQPVGHAVVRLDLQNYVPGWQHVLTGVLRVEPEVVHAVSQVGVDGQS